MYKYLWIFCFVCIVDIIYAQGNLQFNQIIVIECSAGIPTTFTVPQGKVWKIENANSSSNGAMYLYNGTNQNVMYMNQCFPFWLPTNYSGSFYTGSSKGFVSIIEFNIVQ
jgi:hypothetical protein